MNDTLKRIAMLIPPIKLQHEEIVLLRNTVTELYKELDEYHAIYTKAITQEKTQRDNALKDLDDMFEENITYAWKDDTKRKQYVCMQPFNRIEILDTGDVYTCCSSYLKSGLFIGNANNDTIEEMWNSDIVKKLRYSVSKGDFEYCRKNLCHIFMQPEAWPDVMIPRDQWEHDYRDWRECSVDRLPSIVLFCNDLSCNLHCGSCRNHTIVNSSEQNAEISDFLERFIRPALKNLTSLGALGSGEFFASKPMMDFFKTLSRAEYPNLRIEIQTNGTLFTPENWGKLENLKGMVDTISVSIDAAEKATYEKLRRGGSWKVLSDNMEYIASLKASGELRHLRITFVVQSENFRQMKSFVALAKKWNADSIWFQRIRNRFEGNASSFEEIDVFSPNNPHYEEASRLLEECKAETGVTVLYNV